MDELAGKVAVVTGAASGIGRALVDRFAAEGMRIVLVDIEAGPLDAAAAEVGAGGTEVLAVLTDVSDGDQVDALAAATLERFGAVDVVCNNAGVGAGGLIWELSTADWEWVLGVNLWGVIHGIRAFVPHLVAQGSGHVVNTASMAGLTSPPLMGSYNASKHAVVTISETLHADLAVQGVSGVGVSVLCPGWVRTRINESSRNRPAGLTGPPPADASQEDLDAISTVLRGRADRRGRGPSGPAAKPPRADKDAKSERLSTLALGAVLEAGLPPSDVAAHVVDAIRAERFYILTHPEWKPMIQSRVDQIVAEGSPRLGLLPT